MLKNPRSKSATSHPTRQHNTSNTSATAQPANGPYEQELVEAGQTEAQALNDNYGQFAAFLTGENQIYNIENDLMVVSMASKEDASPPSGSKTTSLTILYP